MILYFVANGYDKNKLHTNPAPNIAYKNLVEPTHELDHVPIVHIM